MNEPQNEPVLQPGNDASQDGMVSGFEAEVRARFGSDQQPNCAQSHQLSLIEQARQAAATASEASEAAADAYKTVLSNARRSATGAVNDVMIRAHENALTQRESWVGVEHLLPALLEHELLPKVLKALHCSPDQFAAALRAVMLGKPIPSDG